MNDVEERLRTDLSGLAGSIYTELDLEEVVRRGERGLRVRRGRRFAGVAALVVAAGVLAWGGVATGVLPGPAQPGRVVSGVPSGGTSFDLSSVSFRGETSPYRSVMVSVQRSAAGRLELAAELVQESGEATRVGVTAPESGFVTTKVAERVVAGVVPATTDDLSVIEARGEQGGVSVMTSVLDQLGVTVFVQVYEQAGAEERVRGAIWVDRDGSVQDSSGGQVDAATLNVAGEEALVYYDPDLDVLGVIGAAGGAGWHRDGFGEAAEVVKLVSHADAQRVVLGVLPRGAGAPEVTLDSSGVGWSAGTLSATGRHVFIAVGKPGGPERGPVRTVVYTDADGHRVTYRP